MKKLMLVTVVLVLLAAVSVQASFTPEPNTMGLYLDASADIFCTDGGITPYAQVPLYLTLTNPTPDAIWAFRAGIEMDGLGMVLSTTSPCSPLIVDGIIEFECDWSMPEPTTSVMILATMTILYMDTSMSGLYFFLGSLDDPREGFPSIMLPDGSWMEAELYFAVGPTANINGGCICPSETPTFDSLKAMYR